MVFLAHDFEIPNKNYRVARTLTFHIYETGTEAERKLFEAVKRYASHNKVSIEIGKFSLVGRHGGQYILGTALNAKVLR